MHLKVMIAAQFLIKKDWKHLKYPYIGDDWFNQKNTKSHRHKEQRVGLLSTDMEQAPRILIKQEKQTIG